MVVGTPAGLGSDICHVTQQTVSPTGSAHVLQLLQVSRMRTVPRSFDGTQATGIASERMALKPWYGDEFWCFSPFVFSVRIDSPLWSPVSSASRPHTTPTGFHTLGPPGGKTTSSSAALYTRQQGSSKRMRTIHYVYAFTHAKEYIRTLSSKACRQLHTTQEELPLTVGHMDA